MKSILPLLFLLVFSPGCHALSEAFEIMALRYPSKQFCKIVVSGDVVIVSRGYLERINEAVVHGRFQINEKLKERVKLLHKNLDKLPSQRSMFPIDLDLGGELDGVIFCIKTTDSNGVESFLWQAGEDSESSKLFNSLKNELLQREE